MRRNFESADATRSASQTLLTPDEVAGEYDISRKLFTTLGSPDGKPVLLTPEHLREFAKISADAAKRLRKGVTAKAIIDSSLAIDRERANTEIRTAVPTASHNGQITFMTDTGPNSDRERQYVVVNFLNFLPVVASAIAADKTGRELTKSPLQISCSCGRWRFWLAYLATKAGFNSGAAENAFPKIRNPGLSGIACKHILRVMTLIKGSPTAAAYLTAQVKTARRQVVPIKKVEKVADTRALAESLKGERWESRQVKTTEELRSERRAARERQSFLKAANRKPAIKRIPAGTRRIGAAIARGSMTEADLATLRKFGMTDAQIARQIEKSNP